MSSRLKECLWYAGKMSLIQKYFCFLSKNIYCVERISVMLKECLCYIREMSLLC